MPGEIDEYAIEIMATANLFRKGHRICLDITSIDLPTGVAGATNVEYVPYTSAQQDRRCTRSSRPQHPSHLLLPIIPQTDEK